MVLRHGAARIVFLAALAALVAGCAYNNGYPYNYYDYPPNGTGGPGTNGYPTNPSATSS